MKYHQSFRFLCASAVGLSLALVPAVPAAADLTVSSALRNLSRLDARLSWQIDRSRWIGGARWNLLGVREEVAPAGYTQTEVLLHPLTTPDRAWVGFAAPGVAFGPLVPHGQVTRLLNPGSGGAGAPAHGAPTQLRLDTSLYPTAAEGVWIGAQGDNRLLGILPPALSAGVWRLERADEYGLTGVNAALELHRGALTVVPWALLAHSAFQRTPYSTTDPWRGAIPLSRSGEALYHALGVTVQPYARTRLQLEGWLARPRGEQAAGAASVHLFSAWTRRTVALWGWLASPAYRPPHRQAVVNAALLAFHGTAATPARRLDTALDLRWRRPVETSRRVAPLRLEVDARARFQVRLPLDPQLTVAMRFRGHPTVDQGIPERLGASTGVRARWGLVVGGVEFAADQLSGRMEYRVGADMAVRTAVVSVELGAAQRWTERRSDWRETLDVRAVLRTDSGRRWYLTIVGALNDLDRHEPDWTAVRDALLGSSGSRAGVTATVHARILDAPRR